MSEIVNLAERTAEEGPAAMKDILRIAGEDIDGGDTPQRGIIIFLDDEPKGNYYISRYSAGLRLSEIVALLEVTKQGISQSLIGQ